MKISIIYILFLILAVSCNNKSRHQKAIEEIIANAPSAKNMNAGNEDYTLYIPDGWTTSYKTIYGIDYYFLSAPKTLEDTNTSINVATEYMQNLSLQEYHKKTIASIQQGIPSSKILSQGDITANGLKGAWYSYYMEPQGIKATLISYIFPKDGVAYIITGGTQPKDADKYRKLFDKVASSLQFNQ